MKSVQSMTIKELKAIIARQPQNIWVWEQIAYEAHVELQARNA
jgi:hypothetical protein